MQSRTPNSSETVSAQVILRPATGRSLEGVAITAATIQDYAPSRQAIVLAQQTFARAGFEVGEVIGNSFSITAPLSRFEQFFGTRLRRSRAGLRTDRGNLELPSRALPPQLSTHIEAVTFTPPPDFGPTNHSSAR